MSSRWMTSRLRTSKLSEGEKVRAQAMAESMAQQFSVQAIQQMAKIQDLRGEYF